MEANEKTFRHSLSKLAVLLFGVLFLGVLAFSFGPTDYFLFLITGPLLIIALFYFTSSVKISSDEITTTRLLGSKSLRWSEIAHASTFGQALRLHNYDDDLVLSIDSQLDGYPDILEIIFSKRPDLLDKNDDHVMSIGWLDIGSTLGVGFFIIIIAVFQFLGTKDVDKIFSLLFFAVGTSIIVKWVLSPKSLTLEGENLIVGYFFKELSHSAKEIDFVSLEKQSTRNGYVYSVQINLASGKKIKLPPFKQGAPLTYQILKRWHKKAATNQLLF